MINLTPLLQAVIGLLASLITYKLIPWIKANTTQKQQAILDIAVQTAVFAAEQIYGDGHGMEKLDYAMTWLHDRGYDIDRTQVEACVYNFLNGTKEDKQEKENG